VHDLLPKPVFADDEQARRYLLARADLIIALGALLRSGCNALGVARSGQSPSGHRPTLAAKKDVERKPAALSVWRSASSADAASVAFTAARCRGAAGIVEQHRGPAHQSSLHVDYLSPPSRDPELGPSLGPLSEGFALRVRRFELGYFVAENLDLHAGHIEAPPGNERERSGNCAGAVHPGLPRYGPRPGAEPSQVSTGGAARGRCSPLAVRPSDEVPAPLRRADCVGH
jgi:hypothetical protein